MDPEKDFGLVQIGKTVEVGNVWRVYRSSPLTRKNGIFTSARAQHDTGVGLVQQLSWSGCDVLRSRAQAGEVVEGQPDLHERLHERSAEPILQQDGKSPLLRGESILRHVLLRG